MYLSDQLHNVHILLKALISIWQIYMLRWQGIKFYFKYKKQEHIVGNIRCVWEYLQKDT